MRPELPPLALNAWLRWDAVTQLIGPSPRLGAVVEIGCGQGAFGVRLASRADSYRAYEPDAASFETAASRLASVDSAVVLNQMIPDPPGVLVDMVCAFEVLEHIEDDSEAIGLWSEWLKPGGRLMVSVPAHQSRYGAWDRAVGHYRRYGREDLRTLLVGAGLEVEAISAYGFPLGYALEWARNRLAPPADAAIEELTGKSGRLLQPASWMSKLTQLATLPFRWLQRRFVSTDRGTGWVVVALRPQ